jgi:endonuclease/exonuclease/phosphatase family metal-dependent hydrolase
VRVRVVTYNVRGFRDDLAALERTVRSLAPDVLLLNETGARWRLRRFAADLDLALASDPWSPLRRRAKDAVLVRSPWRIADQRQQRFTGSRFLYPRAALLARLERDGVDLWAVATHLGLRPAERRHHAEQLLSTLEELDAPVIVAGDTNELADGKAMTMLDERYPDAWGRAGEGPAATIPADVPTTRIDYVFTSPSISTCRSNPASAPPRPRGRTRGCARAPGERRGRASPRGTSRGTRRAPCARERQLERRRRPGLMNSWPTKKKNAIPTAPVSPTSRSTKNHSRKPHPAASMPACYPASAPHPPIASAGTRISASTHVTPTPRY